MACGEMTMGYNLGARKSKWCGVFASNLSPSQSNSLWTEIPHRPTRTAFPSSVGDGAGFLLSVCVSNVPGASSYTNRRG